MTWKLKQLAAVLAVAVTTLLLGVGQSVADEHAQNVLNSFASEIQKEQLDETTLSRVKATLAEGQSAPADAITESLLLLSPAYAVAIENADADDVVASIETLAPLTKSANKFLAADASFYLARTLMNSQRFEEAMPLLDDLTGDLGKHSAHRGTAQYYTGVAQAGLLQNKKAIESLMAFLQFNQDAAERLRVGAWRKVQELQAIKPGKLDDIHQRMDFSRRRLAMVETDDTTQAQQGKIVSMLTKLIKEEEKKELSKSKGGKPKGGKPKGGKPKGASQKPQQSKKGKGGKSSSNANGTAEVKTYDDAPASPWSRLRDRSRDPANNAVKDKLPARYRDLVEKYTEAANGEK